MDKHTIAKLMLSIRQPQSIASAILCAALISPLTANADDLADLIQLKTQSFLASTPTPSTITATQHFYQSYATAPNIDVAHIDTLYLAEQQATPASKQVLQTVRQMTLDHKEIINGSCWDYLNAAFMRAGVTRDTVFKGEYPYGPFVDTNEIQPGDWLYYVNHSYNDVEHSGLFVGWLDRQANQALILSYAGENRQEPARYKVYDVSHTYNIMRPR
ncbi:hypothetical protein [Psychrobacter lutiphocae]|uniref:hypothetical protein n=1 Tax=Psychrobacter lutiphocae TaxID=540500 RepID=UPI00035E1C10|nr:hypothetical protein [Psychrobacter lutiphocae]